VIFLLRATFLHLCRSSYAHSSFSYNGSSWALSYGPRMAAMGSQAVVEISLSLTADIRASAPKTRPSGIGSEVVGSEPVPSSPRRADAHDRTGVHHANRV
jgi:hypothetical protein